MSGLDDVVALIREDRARQRRELAAQQAVPPIEPHTATVDGVTVVFDVPNTQKG